MSHVYVSVKENNSQYFCGPTCGRMVRRTLISQPNGVQVRDMTLVLAFSWIYSRPSGDVRSVGGDFCVDFINLKMMCRLNYPSKVLIGIGCARS